MQNLRVDPDRLWADLMESGEIGATAKGGLCRLALSDADRAVRDWFKARAAALGCTVTVDDMGVMFAYRAGRGDVAPIAIGSHLDTQPTGGKFDGALGVIGALEALRVLVAAGYETFAPIEVVNWTNEEGARFTPAMMASGVFAGAFARDWAAARADRSGATFGAALEASGYRGEEPCGRHPLSALFELHIEQGPVLESENLEIGIVTGVQAMRWYEATIRGQEAHTGATPMAARRNALIGAARLVGAIDAIARDHPPGVGTVGMMEVRPNSPNVVPGEVFLTMDLRHPQADTLDAMERRLDAAFADVRSGLGLDVESSRIWDQPPVRFDRDCVASVRAATWSAGYTGRDMISGAGHDAAYVARVAPAAMIFVPCRGGISHNEAEAVTREQCAAGAQVLLQAVLDFDRRLAERHGADS